MFVTLFENVAFWEASNWQYCEDYAQGILNIEETIHSEFTPPDITINSPLPPRRSEMIEGGSYTREVAKMKHALVRVINHLEHFSE